MALLRNKAAEQQSCAATGPARGDRNLWNDLSFEEATGPSRVDMLAQLRGGVSLRRTQRDHATGELRGGLLAQLRGGVRLRRTQPGAAPRQQRSPRQDVLGSIRGEHLTRSRHGLGAAFDAEIAARNAASLARPVDARWEGPSHHAGLVQRGAMAAAAVPLAPGSRPPSVPGRGIPPAPPTPEMYRQWERFHREQDAEIRQQQQMTMQRTAVYRDAMLASIRRAVAPDDAAAAAVPPPIAADPPADPPVGRGRGDLLAAIRSVRSMRLR